MSEQHSRREGVSMKEHQVIAESAKSPRLATIHYSFYDLLPLHSLPAGSVLPETDAQTGFH